MFTAPGVLLYWFTCQHAVTLIPHCCRDAIVKWVTKMTGPATKVITTVEELKKAEADSVAIVVGYFAVDTPENDTALTEFIKTARMDVNDIFYQTSVSAVAEAAAAPLGSFSVISTFKVLNPPVVRLRAANCSSAHLIWPVEDFM